MINLKDHRKVVYGFLDALKNEDYELMVKFCQKTWVKEYENPVEIVKAFYEWFKLLSYTVEFYREVIIPENVSKLMTAIEVPPGSMIDYKVRLTFRVGDTFYDRGTRLRLVCEEEAHTPSAQGDWGINPLSPQEIDREKDGR